MPGYCGYFSSRFLSTPSARRATSLSSHPRRWMNDFIHALREEGDMVAHRLALAHRISIHALREEGDARSAARSPTLSHFYPRPPRGGRHLMLVEACHLNIISIHALREEGRL